MAAPSVQIVRGTLPDHVVADVRALAQRVERHDGVEAFGEQALLDLAADDEHVVHVLVAEPLLLAYAQVRLAGTDAGGELAVDPDARRRGLGTALLGAVRELAATEGASLAVWAHGDLPAARSLAARTGMAVVRELWQMTRDLADRPAAGEAAGRVGGSADLDGSAEGGSAEGGSNAGRDGIAVRPFVVGRDEGAWLDLNARAFAWHPEQGRMSAVDLRARQAEPWFDPADLLLAEADGRLVASAWIKVEPGSDAGELYALAVDPDAQGRGLGRMMTGLTLDHLARRGLRRAVLYTEADNAGAVRTYRAAGFTTSRVDVQYR